VSAYTVHDLKCWPEPFEAVLCGRKAFEYRIDDRWFQDGDALRLREWMPDAATYSGRVMLAFVTYVLRGGEFGVPFGYCVMSIQVSGSGVLERSKPLTR
jgi:hypothetical protein